MLSNAARVVLVWVALCSAILPAFSADGSAADKTEIERVIKSTWERPDNRVDVRPVVIADNYAVAGWIAGERGGRALLKRHAHAWQVVLCSGDGIRTAGGLMEAGVPDKEASTLADKLAIADAALPPDIVRKFSLFEGSLAVEHGVHPAHDQHEHK